MDYNIVKMTADFAKDFGYVIYTAWGETYRGLMPDSILDGRSVERWAQRAKENPENKYIAFAGGHAVGIVGFLPQARDFVTDKNSGEIVALYVLKKYQKCGIGKMLLEKAIKSIDYNKVTLFVLKDNENAIEFYKHMGFEFTGKELEESINNEKIYELEMIKR